jgi:hypothetical protein
LRNSGFPDPDGKFPTSAFNHVGLDPGSTLDKRRHPGSAWAVVSNLAITDLDRGHVVNYAPFWRVISPALRDQRAAPA